MLGFCNARYTPDMKSQTGWGGPCNNGPSIPIRKGHEDMPKNTARIAHLLRLTATVLALTAVPVPSLADVATPKVAAQQGKPTLLYGAYDLAALGYQMDEFFLAGNANSYQIAPPVTGEGNWSASVAATAPYA